MAAAPTPPCKPGDICSSQFGTIVGGTNLFFATQTTLSTNGGGTSILNYWDGNNWIASATSTDGKSWTPTSNSPLSQTAIQSLNSGDLGKNSTATLTKTLDKAGVPKTTQSQVVPEGQNQASETATIPTTQAVQDAIGEIDERGGTRNKYGALRYPEKLKSEHQDVIKFTMLKYEPTSFTTSSNNVAGFSERSQQRTTLGTVILPIPGGVSDTNSVSWGEDRMTPAQIAAASVALTGITQGAEAAISAGSNYLTSALNNSKDLKAAIAAGFAEKATGVSGLLQRTAGIAVNQNLELLFQGPSLRPFNFTFKLSARGKRDKDQIVKIIRFFKQGMSAQRTESNLFLKAPNTFKIEYRHKGETHKYMNLFKECALQSFSVNYTPEGNYMTFDDGLMTSYEITMQFTEIEPIYNDDYPNDNDQSIGY